MKKLLKNYNSFYSDSWSETVSLLVKEDREVIRKLREELRRNGSFRDPVLIAEGSVQDGHHRVVASILEDVEEINVLNRDDYKLSDGRFVTVIETIDTRSNDKDIDSLSSILRSFKLNNLLWLTSESFSWSPYIIEVDWSDDPALKYSIPELEGYIKYLLKDMKIRYKEVRTEWVLWE